MYHFNFCVFKGSNLVFTAPLGSADNSPGMAHALALGGCEPGNKTKDRFGVFAFLDVGGGGFLTVSTDLADQAHGLGFWVVTEHLEQIGKVQTRHRVAANTHACALPSPCVVSWCTAS